MKAKYAYERIEKLFENYDGLPAKVTAGIHKEDNGTYDESEETYASVGAKHEFGIEVIRRPWLSSGIERHMEEHKHHLKWVFNQIAHGKLTLVEGLEQLAIQVEDGIKTDIRDRRYAPNSPITIMLKGSDTPLIDTSGLINAIKAKASNG